MSEWKNEIEVKSERLRKILLYVRRILGWSAVVLGEKLGISRQSVNKIESGKSGLSKTEYLLLRRILAEEMDPSEDDHSVLPVVLEVLVDHPEKYSEDERNEVLSKLKLVAPTVIEPAERKHVSSSWRGILLTGGGVVTAALIALLKGMKED